ncbi:long-chain N-acyl amino acid synthase [Inhella sp.]|uniref:N-acyl amino acid synthase FeeM domain-containing protein n=1 Tax=Inhella sp. TaxID=1921806 RepID=UPI0035B1CC76
MSDSSIEESGPVGALEAWLAPVAPPLERFAAERVQGSAGWLANQALVGRRYGQRGLRVTPLEMAADGLASLRVREGDQVVGTLTVRMDGPAGLAADAVFPEELRGLREQQRLCEFTRLAVDGGTESKPVLARLFHMAYLYAHRIEKAELIVFEVHPRHSPFYRRMLGSRLLAGERLDPAVNAPAVLMCKPLDEMRRDIETMGGRADLIAQARSLYPLFYGPAEEAALLREMRLGV